MPNLLDVVTHLNDIAVANRFEGLAPTIFARRPWTPQSDALVLRDQTTDGMTSTAPDHVYLLEVDIAQEVVEVWSTWRDGATPTAEEATLAIIYYAEHDAYQPNSLA
jgi:hypothetical protein